MRLAVLAVDVAPDHCILIRDRLAEFRFVAGRSP